MVVTHAMAWLVAEDVPGQRPPTPRVVRGRTVSTSSGVSGGASGSSP